MKPAGVDVSLQNGELELESVSRTRQAMDLEQAEIVGRRVALALYRGSGEVALEIVREAWDEHLSDMELPTGYKLLDEPLARVLDDVRTLNALDEHLGIVTIGDFLKRMNKGLPRIPNVGEITLHQLRKLAVDLALQAGEKPPPNYRLQKIDAAVAAFRQNFDHVLLVFT